MFYAILNMHRLQNYALATKSHVYEHINSALLASHFVFASDTLDQGVK